MRRTDNRATLRLIHTYHAVPMPCCAVVLGSRFQNGMVTARQGHGKAFVNQTRPRCVNQMGKTQSKALATQHGRGTEWYGHGMVCVNYPLMCRLSINS